MFQLIIFKFKLLFFFFDRSSLHSVSWSIMLFFCTEHVTRYVKYRLVSRSDILLRCWVNNVLNFLSMNFSFVAYSRRSFQCPYLETFRLNICLHEYTCVRCDHFREIQCFGFKSGYQLCPV